MPSPTAVEHLRLGEGGHRVRLPVEVQPLSAGVKGGLVGGVAMAVVALAYGLLVQGSLWYPINLLAAVGDAGHGARQRGRAARVQRHRARHRHSSRTA